MYSGDYEIVNNFYKEFHVNLKSLGFNVIDGRLLMFSEVDTGGIAYSYRNSGSIIG